MGREASHEGRNAATGKLTDRQAGDVLCVHMWSCACHYQPDGDNWGGWGLVTCPTAAAHAETGARTMGRVTPVHDQRQVYGRLID